MKNPKDKNGHLNRQELLQAAAGENRHSEHLKDCRECRETVELLKTYAVTGKPPLPDAPAAFVTRAIAIAGKTEPIKKATEWLGQVIFDSWRMPHPVGVRGTESLEHRRLRFDARGVLLDLRAEKMPDSWIFVAQVSGIEASKVMITPAAGGKPIFADKSGLFLWTSKRPPKNLSFQFDETVVELPELSWKKSRSI